MATLLEKALEKVVALPQDAEDAIASQILASLADEDAWKTRFAGKRAVLLTIRIFSARDDSHAAFVS
ncbi:MAG: hypothetical protein Q8N47_10170 [Bryobacterales bacterium]|nr:hypothetical protein [Bryobacterales bacterium]